MQDLKDKIKPKLWKVNSKELELYLGKSITTIEGEYQKLLNHEKVIESNLHENATETDLNTYYSSTNKYLYELMRWEASLDKQLEFERIFLFLRKNNIKTVLDFGGGVGGLCIYLSERGITCDYLDIFGETFKFAKYRFEKRKYNIKMFNALEKWPDHSYQAVIAYDVLEHLTNLEEIIKKISSIIDKTGFLLHKSSFSGGGIHLKENEAYSDLKIFNSMLKDSNLIYYGRLKNSIISELLRVFSIYKVIGIRLSKKEKYGCNVLVYKKL